MGRKAVWPGARSRRLEEADQAVLQADRRISAGLRPFSRPFGTRTVRDSSPALKRRAILRCPFGTKPRMLLRAEKGHPQRPARSLPLPQRRHFDPLEWIALGVGQAHGSLPVGIDVDDLEHQNVGPGIQAQAVHDIFVFTIAALKGRPMDSLAVKIDFRHIVTPDEKARADLLSFRFDVAHCIGYASLVDPVRHLGEIDRVILEINRTPSQFGLSNTHSLAGCEVELVFRRTIFLVQRIAPRLAGSKTDH